MQNTKLTPIAEIIASNFPPNVEFKPFGEFYSKIGINKHRYAKIFKGELHPDRAELISISDYFRIPITNFFN